MLELPGGMVLQFEAIDPDTGAVVAGPSVSNVAVYSEPLGESGIVDRIIPRLTPIETETG